jgi:hypothetical protein
MILEYLEAHPLFSLERMRSSYYMENWFLVFMQE